MQQSYEMLRQVSRTFALSIEQLPQGPRDALTLGYLLLRISDGIEDHPAIEAGQKAELLELWHEVLTGAAEPERLTGRIDHIHPINDEMRVALAAQRILGELRALPRDVQDAVLREVRATTRGMARWQRQGPRVATLAGLDDYMHEVAGRVGYLITDVFACHSPAIAARRVELRALGREFGLGLQTVNIVRGVPSDHLRGWTFVPADLQSRFGLTDGGLLQPESLERSLAVMDALITKAEGHLAFGLQYVLMLPRRLHRLRLMCMWPLLFAARTLAISRDNPAVLQSEAKIGRSEVRQIMRDAAALGWWNGWLRRYYQQLLDSPRARRTGEGG